MVDFKALRKDFPLLKKVKDNHPLVYLDTAATALKPQVMIDTIKDFYENHYGTVHRAIYFLSTEATFLYNQVRKKVQKFISATKPEEIIFTKGTTESINLVASSFGKQFIQKGDEIILSESEHHSNLVPWQILAQEREAILRFIPINAQGELDLDVYQDLLNERTKLVSVAHISNALGVLHPIKKIIEMAHQYGAKVLIDAAQSAPHKVLNVQELDVDFLVFSAHKLYGPTGLGILFGKLDLLEALPPYQGGGDMIQEVSLEKSTFNAPPLKFEAGTPMIAEVIGFGASLDYISNIGLRAIEAHEMQLLHYTSQKLQALSDIRILGNAKEKGAILSFTVENVHPLDLATFLDLSAIAIRTGHHCSQTTLSKLGLNSFSRVSFGLYNTEQEIDIFVDHLQKVKKLL